MRTLTLRYSDLSRWDDYSSIVMPDDFTFKVNGMDTVNTEYVAIMRVNGIEHKYKITDTVTIPCEDLSAGKLELSIGVYLDGNRICEYIAEPLYVTEELGELTLLPAITEIENKISDIENKLSEYESRVQNEIQEIACQITAITNKLNSLQTDFSRHVELEKNDYDPLRV